MGLFADVRALVVAALAPVLRDLEAVFAGSEIHELPHPARAHRRLGEGVEVRLLPGDEGDLFGQPEGGELLDDDRPILLLPRIHLA